MKTKVILGLLCICTSLLRAATPEQEKAFVDKYKAAFEASDKATLESFLYTKGAHPMALEFYKMMQTGEMGKKISTIELRDLTADEAKEAGQIQEGPDGEKTKMPLKPTKKLKITIESKGDDGNSSSSSESFVAELDGKFVIPVPAAVK
ncbi:MAG: hypothetical protein ABIR71_12225 [Chthoniobacterales bacterium]